MVGFLKVAGVLVPLLADYASVHDQVLILAHQVSAAVNAAPLHVLVDVMVAVGATIVYIVATMISAVRVPQYGTTVIHDFASLLHASSGLFLGLSSSRLVAAAPVLFPVDDVDATLVHEA